MTKSSTFAKGALAVAAGLVALGAAATASAQPYGGSGYYDNCQRDAGNRGIVGALLGGAGGATIGSQFAANGHRRDGSLLGGVLGAFAGAAVGRNTAGCNSSGGYAPPPPPPPPRVSYYDNGYAPYAGGDYAPAPYAEREDYDRGDRDDRYAEGRHGERLRIAQRPGADGCTLAESPVYLPDGRVQKRFVRVCMDERGRYQVVN